MSLTDFLHLVTDVIMNTLSITALVMVMLLLVEFVHVSSSGKIMERLKNKPLLQIFVATLLGLIPGCLGGFAVVSLFTHKLLSFGALVAGMISSFGDEVFVIFAISPKWTLILALCLVGMGIITGIAVYFLSRKKKYGSGGHSFVLHHDDHNHDHQHTLSGAKLSFRNLKKMSFPRAILLFGLVVYLFFLLSGTFTHQHAVLPTFVNSLETEMPDCNHEHEPHDHGSHRHEAHDHGTFSWENILFITLAFITLVIVAFSSEHFLTSHLWEHVIKQHFFSILLWTFSVLFLLQMFFYFVDIRTVIGNHHWALLVILFLALLIGIIPESGPHLIFVIMFFNGAIPFSILLANSIVQDGHSALPLLAESRKNFLKVKFIKIGVGLLAGLLGYFIGF